MNRGREWSQTVSQDRWFDPPLTKTGFKQAQMRGIWLYETLLKYFNGGKDKNNINNIDNDNDNDNEKTQSKFDLFELKDKPRAIFCSPLDRTLGTAHKIAIENNLPIIVTPGLCQCAAAIKRYHYFINKNNNQLYLGKDHSNKLNTNNHTNKPIGLFLTRDEILKKYSQGKVKSKL